MKNAVDRIKQDPLGARLMAAGFEYNDVSEYCDRVHGITKLREKTQRVTGSLTMVRWDDIQKANYREVFKK